MSDPQSFERVSPDYSSKDSISSSKMSTANPLLLIDECLASLTEGDHRLPLLHRLKKILLQHGVEQQQREAEMKKLATAVEQLTAPANRIGTLLDLPQEGVARILVGGGEYYANVDPRLESSDLKVGAQILVNEAYVVIRSLGYDPNGPLLTVHEVLSDGRLRMEQEPGRQRIVLQPVPELMHVEFQTGDEVRVDPSHRYVIERMEKSPKQGHMLAEVPTVKWEDIGGQKTAIDAIRRAIAYPLLHSQTFQQYQFIQPKGFLLHGPPGCGKTLIGQATAASLAQLVKEKATQLPGDSRITDRPSTYPPITQGCFLHVKGPEVLNMWVGESERIVRELFAQARERRKAGLLPFIFIDEAESILGTRRAVRSYNISNTLVPMFCAELDGIETLHDVVVILASNRPDLIDPAVLRPGRIDRKVKVNRPNREEAEEILRIYVTNEIPLDMSGLAMHPENPELARQTLLANVLDQLFARTDENRVLAIRLRNGRQDVLYRRDIVSGAILANIVRRAKERAIEREISDETKSKIGLSQEDFEQAMKDEFSESEILPPDDSAEEWLKLLDHHPNQVIGVSTFMRRQPSVERMIHTII